MVDEEEIWKTYPEFPSIEANQFGKIRTKDRIVTDKNGKKRYIKGRVLKQSDNGTGYLQVGFGVNGKKFYLYVHRIMATCFIPNPDNLPEVNHINNDRTNNAASNLEWCTTEQNIAHREKCGVSAAEAVGRSVFAVDLKTGKVLRFETQSEAAHQLNVHVGSIGKVVKGELNQTGGYWFTEDESEITKEKIQEIKDSMRSYPVIAINPETSEAFWFESQSEAARQLGFEGSHITTVINGKRNKTHGYWFCRADENAVEKTRNKFGNEVAEKVEELMRES